MTETKFEKDLTALLIVDPFNDFISDGGKLWPSAKAVAEANNCVGNMRDVLKAARGWNHGILRSPSSMASRRLFKMEIHLTQSEASRRFAAF